MTKMKIKKKKNTKSKEEEDEPRNEKQRIWKKKNCFSKRKTIQQQTIRLAELAQTALRWLPK
jgi:hypothetical protein